MQRFILLVSLWSIMFSLFSQQTITKTIFHDGIEREYLLYIPENYSGYESVPLLFNFHGFGGNAMSQMENGVSHWRY